MKNPIEIAMAEALALAKQSARENEVPIGAVIWCDGKVIGRGRNQREEKLSVISHAEIEALLDFQERSGQWILPPGAAVISTLEPCLMCTGAILAARATHVYFGCSDPRTAGIEFLRQPIESGRFDHRIQTIQGGILEEPCSQVLKEFFRKKRTES